MFSVCDKTAMRSMTIGRISHGRTVTFASSRFRANRTKALFHAKPVIRQLASIQQCTGRVHRLLLQPVESLSIHSMHIWSSCGSLVVAGRKTFSISYRRVWSCQYSGAIASGVAPGCFPIHAPIATCPTCMPLGPSAA
jgi:hypothetical protein